MYGRKATQYAGATEIAGVENAGADRRGGKCRSGKCRSRLAVWKPNRYYTAIRSQVTSFKLSLDF